MQTSMASQTQPQPALQPVPDLPPEPHCVTWYSGSPCDVLKQQYQAAVKKRAEIQLSNYVETQKAQAAADAAAKASAPLQQQVSDLQKQTADLQAQAQQLRAAAQKQQSAAIQAKEVAHDEGFREGAVRGAGIALAVVLVVLVIVLVVKRVRGRYTLVRTEGGASGPSAL